MGRVLAFLGVLGLLGCLLVILAGEQVISLVYGVDMGRHWELLYLMVGSTVLTAAQLFLVDLLIVMGKSWLSVMTSLVVFVASIVLSNVLLSSDQNSVSVVLSVVFCMGMVCSIVAGNYTITTIDNYSSR